MALPEQSPEYRIPDIIRKPIPFRSYVEQHDFPTSAPRINLSEGASPHGGPPEFEDIVKELVDSGEYSRASMEYRDADLSEGIANIRERYGITDEPYIAFTAGEGSNGMLKRIIKDGLKQPPARTHIYGLGPHFTYLNKYINDYRDRDTDEKTSERYMVYANLAPSLYSTPGEALEFAMDARRRSQFRNVAFYLCNPGTPKGDVARPDEIQTFVEYCARRGDFVIIDEAIGDVLPDDESAIRLTEDYPNLAVLRTFSKQIGLPGLGISYGVMSREVGEEFDLTFEDYAIRGNFPEYIARLTDPTIIKRHLARVNPLTRGVKEYAMKRFDEASVKYLPTDPRTPIMTVEADIQLFPTILKEVGIDSVQGAGFNITHPNINSRHARLTMPRRIREAYAATEKIIKANEAISYNPTNPPSVI